MIAFAFVDDGGELEARVHRRPEHIIVIRPGNPPTSHSLKVSLDASTPINPQSAAFGSFGSHRPAVRIPAARAAPPALPASILLVDHHQRRGFSIRGNPLRGGTMIGCELVLDQHGGQLGVDDQGAQEESGEGEGSS